MKNEKIKEKDGKMPLWLKLICVLGLAFLGYKGYDTWKLNVAKKDWMSPTPTVNAITKQEFEDYAVGLIYEVPEEDQKAYLEAAKTKYETYKHLGATQTATGVWNPEYYLTPREDVIARGNSAPTDMLNEDMSLRYPDMFYGFIIHDENLTGENSKKWVNSCDNDDFFSCQFRKEKNMTGKMNQIFYVEKEFNNGMKIHEHYGSTMENSYMGCVNGAVGQDYPEAELFRRAVKSDFYKPDKEIGVVRTIFQYMFATTGSSTDPYDSAYHDMYNNGSSYDFNEVKEIDLFPEKYNDVKNWEDTYGVYYYPTAVWKVDNNTIVVDIAIANGDRMCHDDMYEILSKLNQSNTHLGNNSSTQLYPPQLLESDTYLVMGRFFDAKDITNGIVPEYGVHVLNYKSIDDWQNGLWIMHDRSTYVFNDKAKEFLKEFYNILEKQLETNNNLSTKKMIQQAANKTGVLYQDALNIYATHYSYSFLDSYSSLHWQ